MSYTIYTKGITSNFFDKDGYKIGFWCYYLRTENTTELKCKVVKSEDAKRVTAPRMQLKSIIEALKFCENDSFVDSIKLYTNNQQYFKQCFENEKSRKKNKDLWAQIDKLKLDKGLIIFPEDKDNAVKQSRGMKILEAAIRDTQAHNNDWEEHTAHPSLNKEMED